MIESSSNLQETAHRYSGNVPPLIRIDFLTPVSKHRLSFVPCMSESPNMAHLSSEKYHRSFCIIETSMILSIATLALLEVFSSSMIRKLR